MLKEKMYKTSLVSMAVIFLGFLLTSTGWIAWNYHVQQYMTLIRANSVTMVAGYAMQALGIGLYAIILRYKPSVAVRFLPVPVLLHLIAMVPALLWTGTAGIAAGLGMEIFCGMIAGFYLYYFTRRTPVGYRGRVFGTGYGLSVPMSWLLSLIGGSSFYYSRKVLAVSAVFSAAMIYIAVRYPAEGVNTGSGLSGAGGSEGVNAGSDLSGAGGFEGVRRGAHEKYAPAGVWLQGILVLLLGVVIGCGFSFVPSSVGEVVNVEMSRLVYVFSLVAAGFVTDRSREKGAICALTVLVFPFVMLSLREAAIPAAVFWLLKYLAFGFYSVYRIILFSDLNVLYMCGFGLMIGRTGDAVGEAISLALYERQVFRVGLAAVLSVGAIFVFFRVYHELYFRGAGNAVTDVNRSAAEKSVEGAGLAAEELRPGGPGPGEPAAADLRSEWMGAAGSNGAGAARPGLEGAEVTGPDGAGAVCPGLDGSGAANLRTESVPENRMSGSKADGGVIRQSGAADEERQGSGGEDSFFRFSARYELSPREREIFRLILSGKTNGEIADMLYISENTVKFHVRNILKKTGCKNRNEIVIAYAAEL